MQAYLAAAQTAEGVVAEAGLDWADTERVGFVLTNLIDALAPSNNPVLNPAAVKAVIDTGGRSAVTGLRHFAADMASPPRIPSMVEPDAFEVGVDLAVTPGAVVLRTPVFELIQYRPATQAVRQVPLLLVPPTINKFYVMDLAPGRSMVEYLVGRGLQVFMISWRNPDARHAKWDFDTYGQAVLDAMDAAARITGSEQAVLAGACSGGIIAAMVAAHLAHAGQQDRMAGLTLLVTVLDQGHAGLGSAVIDERNARLAAAASAARGYLDGRSLAEVFAWLRPNDLIWNYWVNNYLLGRTPPPFDILSWNADTTRMTAGLHRDFLQLGVSNALTRPGGAAMLGSPVDLAAIDRDSYQIAGITDHICPWQSCYRSAGLLGGNSGSCCPPAGTSPRWSTRRATTRPGTRWPRTARRTPLNGCGARRPATGPGGRTMRTGWPSDAGRSKPPPPSWAAAGWRRSATRREPTSMTADAAERIQMLNVGGRVLRVAMRDGNPGRPPLLLCNGIGGRLELFQPFVDALDARQGVMRFDVPGIGRVPGPGDALPPGHPGCRS